MTRLTRRSFVASAVALPSALRGFAEPAAAGPRWIFLGTESGKGIYRATWDPARGQPGSFELAAEIEHPHFFALAGENTRRPTLYAVSAVGNGRGSVSSFRVDPKNGQLTFLNRVSSQGDGPCFVSLDRSGKSAFVASYGGGSVAAIHIMEDGALGTAGGALNCRGNESCGATGPVKQFQDGPHLHCAVISPDNRFVLVCDLGDDAIEVIPIGPGKQGVLGQARRFAARAGSGPRHLVFEPGGKRVYCIHEIDCTIDVYDWAVDQRGEPSLTLRPDSVISTLRKGSSHDGNSGCEIVAGDDGRFVYACTRGIDEITVYRADRTTGLLTEQQRVSSGGKIPRMIAFDPSRRWLVSCNQGGQGNLAVFAHDPATGRLSDSPEIFPAATPMCAVWV